MNIFRLSNTQKNFNPQIFTVYQNHSKIFLIEGFSKCSDALIKLGSLWKEFRKKQGSQKKCNLGYFGRPVIFKSKKGGDSYEMSGRMGSPFYFSIKKFKNNFYITNLLSNTSFREYTCKRKINNQKTEIVISNSNMLNTLINNWENFLSNNISQNNIIKVK
ncbi:MAG: hypothetical protein ACTSPD_18610 [Promethearchaeota archaeon]